MAETPSEASPASAKVFLNCLKTCNLSISLCMFRGVVMFVCRQIDPVGIEDRKRRRLKRRVYVNKV